MFKKACAFVVLMTLSALPARNAQAQTQPIAPIRVAASFSILSDMIQQIGGEDVAVETLVGPDQDAHTFQPAPQDVSKLVGAEIVAINGLKLEGWMHRLIKASGTKAKLLVASAGVKPRLIESDANDHDKGEKIFDPHAWQDLRNGKLYAKNIAAALIEARPNRAEAIKERYKNYIAQIETLDQSARKAFAALPPEKRKIITSHDAFGYFADAYGLSFIAPVGVNAESEPSAADMALLIEQIKRENITSLFIENMVDPRLIQQIAKDTGAKVGGKLYADALSGPDGDAPTYLAMMKANINALLGQ